MASGIIAGSQLPIAGLYITLAIALFILLAIMMASERSRMSSVRYGLLLTLFIFFSGISLYQLSMKIIIPETESPHQFLLRAADYPEERERSVRLPVRIMEIDGVPRQKRGSGMMIYFRDTTGLSIIVPGTYINTELYPRVIEDPDPDDNFDYPAYMHRRGFSCFAFAQPGFTVERGKPGLRNRALRTRSSLIGILSEAGLTGDRLALASALTLGSRDMLGDEITESFRRSGITHILAVSGLHVGILSIIVMSLLSFLRGRLRIVQVVTTIAAIWIFALITGLSPSVTRASLMFTFLHAGRLISRPVNNVNSLLASAFVVLVANPPLLFDAGFQLSYAAVIFIILFFRDLYSLLPVTNRLLDRLWAMGAITILAQAGTLPFIIFYFRSVPLLSVITNIIAIPSAFIIMGCGMSILITSPLPVIQHVAASVVNGCSSLLILIASRISRIPLSSVGTAQISTGLFLSLLLFIPLLTSFILKKDSIHPHLLLSSAIITIFLMTG